VLDHPSHRFGGDVATVGGIRATCYGRGALVDLVAMHCRGAAPEPRTLVDINGQAIALYHTNAAYAAAVDAADVVHADGQAIVFASHLFCRRPIAERAATTDLIHDVAARAERDRLSFYLLGATAQVVATTVARLEARYPRLRIVGWRDGYFDDGELETVAAEVEASGADIVWLGIGKPREQIVADRLRTLTRRPWIITCGGCFNFVAGAYKRAPAWMQALGFEWLYRGIRNPKLLWRYLTTNPVAVFWILRRSA
jgi:exopolysaccharide biosynthesis WecB/TagA/CpsF family protein